VVLEGQEEYYLVYSLAVAEASVVDRFPVLVHVQAVPVPVLAQGAGQPVAKGRLATDAPFVNLVRTLTTVPFGKKVYEEHPVYSYGHFSCAFCGMQKKEQWYG
jgi:hypothetical protein